MMKAELIARWTLDDVNAYCQRYGLTLCEQQRQRMHELSEIVSSTGLRIPRMQSKEFEPALTFVMPSE